MAVPLHVVDQAIGTLKKMSQYIATGMECTSELAIDICDSSADDRDAKLEKLRGIMLEYAEMDNDFKEFMDAVDAVKAQVRDGTLKEDLDKHLDEQLKSLHDQRTDPRDHEKFVDLEDQIKAALGEGAEGSATMEVDDEMFMTQASRSTKCPYTQQEMKDPVKNKHCGHCYDKNGISKFINYKRQQAKCPVAGCPNKTPLKMEDLVPDKELKAYIIRKNKQKK